MNKKGLSFNKGNLNKTLKSLNKYRDVDQKMNKVLKTLSEEATEVIIETHGQFEQVDLIYSEDGSSSEISTKSNVVAESEKNSGGYSTVITGKDGNDWVFFEFGAGVYRNPTRQWNTKLGTPVPSAIVPIGQYGKGQGSGQSWLYQSGEQKVLTFGYGAIGGIAQAINKNVDRVDDIVKEVFDE